MTRRFSRGFSPSRNPLKIRASLGPLLKEYRYGYVCRNPLKIRASLGLLFRSLYLCITGSQSLKDQGKSRTDGYSLLETVRSRNPLKIRASLGPGKLNKETYESLRRNPLKIRASLGLEMLAEFNEVVHGSQSLKDQGKSRTLDSLAFARRQSFSLRKH